MADNHCVCITSSFPDFRRQLTHEKVDSDTSKPRGFLQLRLPQLLGCSDTCDTHTTSHNIVNHGSCWWFARRVRAAGGAAPPLRVPFAPLARGVLMKLHGSIDHISKVTKASGARLEIFEIVLVDRGGNDPESCDLLEERVEH